MTAADEALIWAGNLGHAPIPQRKSNERVNVLAI
jgi:hypothetical protein